jgi:hypothetical protein
MNMLFPLALCAAGTSSCMTSQCSGRALSAPDILVTSAASVTAAVSSVTVGVTDPVTVIASALRRIRPACSQAFSRRLVRILFQPHWRPSLAALTATRPSGWERSQVSASRSSRGIHSTTGRQSGSSCSIWHNVQRTARRCAGGVGRTRISILGMFSGTGFSPPVVDAMRKIVAHVAPAPGRRHDPTISPYA